MPTLLGGLRKIVRTAFRSPDPIGSLRCPVCAAGGPVLFESARERKMVVCRDCRHLFWDKTPTAAELTKFYAEQYCDTHGQTDIQEALREYYRGHVRLLADLRKKPVDAMCLVDYGSSIPSLVREAKAVGFGRAVAVDYDKRSFEYAAEHGLEILSPPDYERQIPAGSVDAIRFSHVLEHTPDPHAVLAAAVDKLAPGGVLYVTQPGFPVFKAAFSGHAIKDSVYPTHLQYFSALSLKRMLDEYPVDVVRFCTHPGADEAYAALKDFMDLDAAREKLAGWAAVGEPGRGEHGNYPYYAGENSELYAVKRD